MKKHIVGIAVLSFLLAGCGDGGTPSQQTPPPSEPSAPASPAQPEAPGVTQPAIPDTPAAPTEPTAPAAPSEPETKTPPPADKTYQVQSNGVIDSVANYATGATQLKIKKNQEQKIDKIEQQHNAELDKILEEE